MEELSKQIANLSPEKRKLLERILKEKGLSVSFSSGGECNEF